MRTFSKYLKSYYMEENRVEQIKAKDIIQKRYFLVNIKEETCKKENYQKPE